MIDVEQLRQRADLAVIARGYGVELRRSGFQLTGKCPFHKERSASFFVHPQKQVFSCHGCQATGDVFTFVKRMEGLAGFRETARRVADLAGYPLTDEPWTAQQKAEYASRRERARQIAAEAQQFWGLVRLRVARFVAEMYVLDRATCAWCLRHQDATEVESDLAWLVFVCLTPYAERLESLLQHLDAADPQLLVSIYLDRRTPKLVASLRDKGVSDSKLAATVVALLAASRRKPS